MALTNLQVHLVSAANTQVYLQLILDVTVYSAGGDRPVCIARPIYRLYPSNAERA